MQLQIATHSDSIQKWLFTELAAVLLASKSGELLNIDFHVLPFRREQTAPAISEICRRWGCEARLMCSCPRAEKWLVYFTERVEDALRQVPSRVLVDKLGYSEERNAEGYVEALAERWSTERKIPHEIGFALGYPVKDVLGFMGLNSLGCSGCCGWCIFGDLSPSKKISSEYQQAKILARQMVATSELSHP